MSVWIPQYHPSHYLFSRNPPTVRYYGPKLNQSSYRVNGVFSTASNAAGACLASMVNGRIDCETMEWWSDEGGSAASFRANDSPTHEELLYREEMEIGEVRQASWPSDLHEDFFDYEIQPDKYVEFFRSNGARLRIQYWAVVGTHFESGSATEGEYHLRIVSGGFRDWGKGYAKGAFEVNLPQDAVIVARYVTLRFVGRLV